MRHTYRHLRQPAVLKRKHLACDAFRWRAPERVRDLTQLFRRHEGRTNRDKRRDRENGQPENELTPGSEAARGIDHQSADRVEHKDVAVPDQICMRQSERQQPEHPAVMDQRRPPAALRNPRGHEQHARPKEQREHRHELRIREHVVDGPDGEVAGRWLPEGRGVEIGREGHGERLNIQDQDAEHGDAADDVHRLVAIGFLDRRNGGLHGRRRHIISGMRPGLFCVWVTVIALAAGCGPRETADGTATRRLSIATGGTGGVYYPYGGGIAQVLSANLPGVEATAEVTAASVDNLKFLRQGTSDIAFTMADTAQDGVAGRDMFQELDRKSG